MSSHQILQKRLVSHSLGPRPSRQTLIYTRTIALTALAGSIYDGQSPRGQHALGLLRLLLLDAGFIVEKLRPTEGTLRVYCEEHGKYPFLSTRLESPGRGSGILIAN